MSRIVEEFTYLTNNNESVKVKTWATKFKNGYPLDLAFAIEKENENVKLSKEDYANIEENAAAILSERECYPELDF